MNTSAPSPHPAAPDADPYQTLFAELSAAVAPLQALHQRAVKVLAPTVQEIVRSASRDTQWIECTLDQLLDHACLPEGLALFETLCRHYWTLDPQTTASYVQAYREMWDADDKNSTEEVAP
ncbi:hypothetical protein HNP55_004691 [Paucibacter oligotrophus]|uniref:Uncharacterized protein n=1 Tax=Roseateles oligotrophus TaxID=1769250 RepID=A0A840LLF3_9BURK|nr:hypothetical protein [Roseateles oligotrophus]MBB4846137.1 hypothetical protein [Roseateles oligotrophus]